MRVLACMVLCLAFAYGNADTPVRAPNCEPPERPNDDVEEHIWEQFRASLQTYRVCISTYVERNQLASDAHRAAANQATLEWNEFVRSSVNAPKDYPWPPKSDSGIAPGHSGAASADNSERSPASQ